MTTRPLFMLRIEVDGHHHGGPPIKPWVARIIGPSERYGLDREFVRAMNDWESAHRACSGNVYGVVATFPLRDGHLYEVRRAAGSSSKRHETRTFHELAAGKLTEIEPEAALRRVSGDAPGAPIRVREFPGRTLVTDLDEPGPVAFVVVGSERVYWLRDGHTYDVRDVGRRDHDRCRIVRVEGDQLKSRTVETCPGATLAAPQD